MPTRAGADTAAPEGRETGEDSPPSPCQQRPLRGAPSGSRAPWPPLSACRRRALSGSVPARPYGPAMSRRTGRRERRPGHVPTPAVTRAPLGLGPHLEVAEDGSVTLTHDCPDCGPVRFDLSEPAGDDDARPCDVCQIGWQDGAGACDEPACPGSSGPGVELVR
jgi:hypothetical protein